jgi:hypothetical protein
MNTPFADAIMDAYSPLLAAEGALISALEKARDGEDAMREIGDALEKTARAQSKIAELLRQGGSPGLAGVSKGSIGVSRSLTAIQYTTP